MAHEETTMQELSTVLAELRDRFALNRQRSIKTVVSAINSMWR